jgi:thiol-disulfide isomerase/thioredoxin
MMRLRNIPIFTLAAGAIIALSVAAQDAGKQGPPARRGPAFTGVEMLPDAPDFELQTLDGKTAHLRDYRGKAVLLNFWATYCVPCKEEMPWLIEFQKKYGPKGLVVLGIAMDDPPAPVRNFVQKMGVNYPILLGNQKLADEYWVKGLPACIFIDRNGKITDQVPGAATRGFLENEIQLALENGAGASKEK